MCVHVFQFGLIGLISSAVDSWMGG